MQSSRRKRDRAENDDKGAAAAPPTRTRSARGAAAQKRLNISQGDQGGGSSTVADNGVSVALSEIVPTTGRLGQQSGSTENSSGGGSQKSLDENVSTDAAGGPMESEDGNDHSSEAEKSVSSQVEAISVEERQSAAQPGKYSREPSGELREGRTDDGSKEDSRERRVSALLSHRRGLRHRIKQCRASAQARLEQLSQQKELLSAQSDAKLDTNRGSGETAKSSGKNGSNVDGVSDDEEIAAFLETSRKAINAAKKQRTDAASEGQAQEKRAPISLRRGSSVGKRMSIALSSLAPNAVGAPSSSTRESQTLPLHEQNAVAAAEGALSGSTLARGDVAGGASAYQMGSHSFPKNVSGVKQQLLPTTSATAIAASGQGTLAGRAGAGSAPPQKIKRSGSHKSVKTYAGGSNRGSSLFSSDSQPSSLPPLHTGVAGSSLPPNRLAQPSVVYPELMALRERRNEVRSKLASLLYDRQKRIEEGQLFSATSRQHPSQSFHLQLKDKASPPSFASVAAKQRGPGPPKLLPRRRKTHWDYLLEEMRWLATDFIEERKWKASFARTLSSAVASSGRTAISSVKRVSPGKIQNGSKVEAAAHDPGSSKYGKNSAGDDNGESTIGDTEPERDGDRRYEPLSATDGKTVRKAATVISDMVAELWDVSVDVGAMSVSDKSQEVSLKRHLKLREKIFSDKRVVTPDAVDVQQKARVGVEAGLNDSPRASGLATDPETKHISNKDTADETMDTTVAHESTHKKAQPEVLSYEQITEQVDTALNNVKNRMDQESDGDIQENLTPSQIVARDFVEWTWGNDCLNGAILDGSSGSGKTVTVCSLLWKLRNQGPHLLICPPARVFRWKHELEQFEGLRVRTFGLNCGISSPELAKNPISKYDPSDVVLCEFSSIPTSSGFLMMGEGEVADISVFNSVTLDCRFQSASHSTVANVSPLNFSVSNGSRKLPQGVPVEIVSQSWWLSLLESLATFSSKRLLIESSGYGKKHEDSMFGCAQLGDRQGLESLASKTAFLLGPALFRSKKRAFTKRVLSWTKRRLQVENEKTSSPTDRILELRRCLFQILKAFSHSLREPMLRTGSESGLQWHVRLCTLPEQQRSEYDRCCTEVRGALSMGRVQDGQSRHSTNDRNSAAASSLLRLRQVCVHPHMHDLLSSRSGSCPTDAMPSNILSRPRIPASSDASGWGGSFFDRRTSQSVSQPDVELAVEILKSSAKLRELLTILRCECGYNVRGEDVIAAAIEKVQSSKSKKGQPRVSPRKKVVVLATLPEAQILTSVLLSATGIAHELLVRSPSTGDKNFGSSGSGNRDNPFERNHQSMVNPVASLAWIECQLALARFNTGPPARLDTDTGAGISPQRASNGGCGVDLIVASPVAIARRNGGIGVPSADLILSLDEDWSGRGELLTRSIISTHQMGCQASKKKACEFIRLVCTNTCEEKFLSAISTTSSRVNESLPVVDSVWPTDIFGYLCLPSSYPPTESKTSPEDERSERTLAGTFSFPGTNITKFQDADLSSVLCSQEVLPPDFMTGTRTRFLPTMAFLDTKTVEKRDKPLHLKADGNTGDMNDGSHSSRSLIDALTELEATSGPLSSNYWVAQKERHGENTSFAAKCLTIAPPLTADMPPMVATRRDVNLLSSRLYVELFGRSFVWDSVGSVSSTPASLHIQRASSFVLGPSEGNVELADAWHKSGLSCNPDDFATSLLVYSSPQTVAEVRDGDSWSVKETVRKTSRISASSKGPVVNQLEETDVAVLGSSFRSLAKRVYGSKARTNSYSSSYSTSRSGRYTVVRDGNQGCEPKVYFPPLFPRMLIGAELAKADLNRLRSQRSSLQNDGNSKLALSDKSEVNDETTKKRKEPFTSDFETLKTGKRPRIHHVAPVSTSAHSNPAQEPALESARPTQTPSSTLTTRATQITLDTDSMEPRAISDGDFPDGDATLLLRLNEDYGLAGIGALSKPADSALAACLNSVEVATYTNWKDQFESNSGEQDYFSHFLACDTEEADALTARSSSIPQLDTMLLFVAKKNLPPWAPGTHYYSAAKNSVGGAQGAATSWAATSMGLSAGAVTAGVGLGNGQLNGSGASKKKKKGQSQNAVTTGASAFSRLPSTGFPVGGQSLNTFIGGPAKAKDGFKNKFISLFTGRQGRQGLSLFNYSSFRLAYVRMRNRVSDRVTQSSLEWSVSSGVGPGVPLILLKGDSRSLQPNQGATVHENARLGWTSIVNKMPADGEKAAAKSRWEASAGAPYRSVESPCRVDFGPFQAGYVSSTSGITAVMPPSPRVGVSLPMGVKIPHHHREQQPSPWTTAEDEVLRECIFRFGLNFQLTARAVSRADFERASQTDQETGARSARQCRERWNYVAKADPSLAIEIRQSESVLRMKAALRPDQIGQAFHDETRKGTVELESAPSPDEQRISVRIGSENILLPSTLVFDVGNRSSPEGPSDDQGNATKSETVLPDLPVAKRKRSFASFRNATTRKQDVPIALPGCTSSDSAPSLVASHPSHMQSVQAAVSGTSSSSGRSDMWPLQILDIADKQRGIVSGRTTTATSPKRSSSSQQQVPRSSGSSVPQGGQTRHQQSSSYQQQTQQRNAHHQRIAPAITSPTRSPHRNSAMASGVGTAVNQQFVAPQPPGALGRAPPSGK